MNSREWARGSCRLTLMVGLLCTGAALVLASPTIYRVVGPDGQISYTDTPPDQGQVEVVELPEANVQRAFEVPQGVGAEGAADRTYLRVEISSPTQDATILPDQFSVLVQLELEPGLHAGHQIQFFLDGAPQGSPATETMITLGDFERGTHSVQAQILDEEGVMVAQSNPVAFHVRRHSAKHPSVNPRPPASPRPPAATPANP